MPVTRPRCRSTHRLDPDGRLRCELAVGHRGKHRAGPLTWSSTPGPKPTGLEVHRHVRLTRAQAEAQDAAAAAEQRDWSAWARDTLDAEARRPRDE